MNWGAFDLNLLVVFDAIMQDRSVTRAGARLGLSQPAVSHALNRLRYMVKDDLFVRAPGGMVPTPRAEQLATPLRNALNEMQLALEPERFVPAEATRQFAVAVNNYAAVVLAPPLVAAVAEAAPRVRLDMRPSGTLDLADRLDRGELDLVIGDTGSAAERFATEPLMEDSFVAVTRRGHPAIAARSKRLTPETFARLPHLAISSSGDDLMFLDQWLAERGLSRTVAHSAPYLAAGAILAGSDMLATLRGRIALEFVRNHALQRLQPPYESPAVEVTMLWHRRLDGQPAHRWLRQTALRVARTIAARDRR